MYCMRSIAWFSMGSYLVPYKKVELLGQYYYSLCWGQRVFIYWMIMYFLILETRKKFFTKRVVRHWNRVLSNSEDSMILIPLCRTWWFFWKELSCDITESSDLMISHDYSVRWLQLECKCILILTSHNPKWSLREAMSEYWMQPQQESLDKHP